MIYPNWRPTRRDVILGGGALAGLAGAAYLWPKSSALPLNYPTMFVIGASLEQHNSGGHTGEDYYGHSPNGMLTWANELGGARLFDVLVGPGGGQYPYFGTPSNFASGGATFDTKREGGRRYTVQEQVPIAIQAMRNVPAGKRACLFSPGRNDLARGMPAETWLAQFEPLLDDILEVADLVIVPGLWNRGTASGGAWAAGGPARAAVAAVNEGLLQMSSRKGHKCMFLPLMDVMCLPTGEREPVDGYVLPDLTHLTSMGAQASGMALRAALLSGRYLSAKTYPALLSNHAPPLTEWGGDVVDGAAGIAPAGYSLGRSDGAIDVSGSKPSVDTYRILATSTEGGAGYQCARLATVPAARIEARGGERWRARLMVDLPADADGIEVAYAFYVSEFVDGTEVRRAYGRFVTSGQQQNFVLPEGAGRVVGPIDTASALRLWCETPDLDVQGQSEDVKIGLGFQFTMRLGRKAARSVDLSNIQLEKIS